MGGSVGVIPGTTAGDFVQGNLPHAGSIAIAETRHAALELRTMKIDLFISDGRGIVWLVSENKASFLVLGSLWTKSSLPGSFEVVTGRY